MVRDSEGDPETRCRPPQRRSPFCSDRQARRAGACLRPCGLPRHSTRRPMPQGLHLSDLSSLLRVSGHRYAVTGAIQLITFACYSMGQTRAAFAGPRDDADL